MAILKNERHELFAQQLAKGETATKAYEIAGFKPSRKNASRLRANEDIAGRVAEIQCNAARATEVSIQSILKELDDAIAVARERGQAQPMVSAAGMKAKLTGLMIDKQELRVSDGEFTDQTPVDEILRRVAAEKGPESAILLAKAFGYESQLTEEILTAMPVVEQKIAYVKQQLTDGRSIAEAQRSIDTWRRPRPPRRRDAI